MEQTTLIVIIGTLFTIGLILVVSIIIAISQSKKSEAQNKLQKLELNRQKEISENTLLSQERERQRVGLELHDDLGPSFSAIRNNLVRVVSQLDRNEIEKAKEISMSTSLELKEAITRFANVSKVLYPVILNRNGLQAAIEDLANKLNESGRLKITLSLSIEDISKELIQLVLYRVSQELLTNAQKHSQANQVSLSITEKNGIILLDYIDDGVGFDTTTGYSGLGLESIKGRVNAINGSVDFRSVKNEGLTVKINIPNEQDSDS